MSLENNQIIEYAEKVLAEILGPERACDVRPLFLKNRTLTITCVNSNLAQEIRLKQQEIVEKINEKLKANEIDRIRYLL